MIRKDEFVVVYNEEAGLEIERVTAVGGISKKSDYIMQMMADVLQKRIAVLEADQTCALGAAIYAAVAGGVYPKMGAAMERMAAKCLREFSPDMEKSYGRHYEEYLRLARLADEGKSAAEETAR